MRPPFGGRKRARRSLLWDCEERGGGPDGGVRVNAEIHKRKRAVFTFD